VYEYGRERTTGGNELREGTNLVVPPGGGGNRTPSPRARGAIILIKSKLKKEGAR